MANRNEVADYIKNKFLQDLGLTNVVDLEEDDREDLLYELDLAKRGFDYLEKHQYKYQVDGKHIELFSENLDWENAEIDERIWNNGIDMNTWSTAKIIQTIGNKLG